MEAGYKIDNPHYIICAAERFAGAGEVGFHGLFGDLQFFGDLPEGISLFVAELENDAAFFGERADHCGELLFHFLIVQEVQDAVVRLRMAGCVFFFLFCYPRAACQAIDHFEFYGSGEIVVESLDELEGFAFSPEVAEDVLYDLFGFV